MKELQRENYTTKIELEEMPNGTWQVREIRIFTYENPLAARNKLEKYMYKRLEGKSENENI